MDSSDFLQRFNDLSDERLEERCRAAEGILKALQSNGNSAKEKDLSYAAKRLIRGCTSGRRSCRQGFCLAVVELLRAFPAQTTEFLKLIKQITEVQSGMRQHEQKDRLLGRLFAHIAVLEAGAFRLTEFGNSESSAFRGSKQQAEAAKDCGEGLHSVCSARPYLRVPSVWAMSTLCQDLCCSGGASQVPDILVPWGLEEAMTVKAEGHLDAVAAGLVLDLRILYEKGTADAHQKDSYRAWPSVLKKDLFAEPLRLTALAKGLGKVVEAAQFGDAVPQTIKALCAWLLHPASKRNPIKLQDLIWPAMDDSLFAPELPWAAQAQGLTTLLEIASCLKANCPNDSLGSESGEVFLIGLFTKFQKGIDLWLRSLNNSKAPLHRVAVHTQSRFQVLITGSSGGQQLPKKKKSKGKGDAGKTGAAAEEPWLLADETRLQILELLQKHSGFASTPKVFRIQWQASLIAPLSSAGVRSRCATLLCDLDQASAQPVDKDRAIADSLGQLALHGNAPDAAILAVICTCFTAAYCIPQAQRKSSTGYRLSKFLDALGVKGIDADDLIIPAPVRTPVVDESEEQGEGEDPEEKDADRAQMWRTKLWALLAALGKRTSAEAAAVLTSTTDGQEGSLRTRAMQGCLADGSLFVSRLHDWWDHTASQRPSEPPKKKSRVDSKDPELCPPIRLGPKRRKLRESCVALGRRLLSNENAGGLTLRQRTALASLVFCLGLALLGVQSSTGGDEEDEEGTEESCEDAKDVVALLEGLFPSGDESTEKRKKKKKGAGQKSTKEIFAETMEMAAQLFVTQVGLVKESARHVWRELGEFAQEETILKLCTSLKDDVDDENAEAENEDDEGSDGDFAPIKTPAKSKSAKDDADEDSDEDEDDDTPVQFAAPIPGGDDAGDEILLDANGIFDQLLDDEGSAAPLMSSFASSSLQDGGDGNAKGKQSKRQQRLQQERENIMVKMRELELLETYINQTSTKKVTGIRAIRELFDALLVTSQRMTGNLKNAKSKSEDALKQLKHDLVRRAAEVVARGIKNTGKGSNLREVSALQTPEKWAEDSQKFFDSIQGGTSAPPQVAIEVAASFLYWMCSMARAASLGAKSLEDDASGWDVGQKLLQQVLQEWSSRNDQWAFRFCHAILRLFAQRSPKLVLRLPWCDSIMEGRKPFVQREQVSFVVDRLLQDARVLGAPDVGGSKFAEDFGKLCISLLESCAAAGKVEGQQRKLQREALTGLAAALKALTKLKGAGGNAKGALVATSLAKRAHAAVTPIRDSLPTKRGELYQLCLQTLRLLGSSATPQSPKLNGAASPSSPNDGKRPAPPQSPRTGPQKAPQSPRLGPKKKVPKVEKGTAEFFESI